MANLTYPGEEPNFLRKRWKSYFKNVCSAETVKKRVPIMQWLPNYSVSFLIQDIIAGVTVGLTAIPQGIAYAVVAGLPPVYGLYAGLMGGFVYLVFGSCKDITVGPTAILSALVAKYVSGYSADFAVLVSFLAGIVELLCGLLHLGFLVEFISIPVITGFTTAAALQIAASQLRSLFGLAGPSGNYFSQSIYNFFENVRTMKLWDPLLGFATIGILVFLKMIGQGCNQSRSIGKRIRWFMSLARNAVVVVVGIVVAYLLQITINHEPLSLIGEVSSGLPKLALPPFNTVIGNETLAFTDMLEVLGPQSVVVPLIAILESVAIAKAFAGGKIVDASQEMIALGLCNIFGSFVSSMPTTGSFTRTALNNASGVQTPAGGIFTGLLIILALSLLTSTFYYIPKSTLAGLIITAMYYMVDFEIFFRLWRNSKMELVPLIATIFVSLFYGLEYGIIIGILVDICIIMIAAARPKLEITTEKTISNEELILVRLMGNMSYCGGEYVRQTILKKSVNYTNAIIIIDATNLGSMDSTVASNLVSVSSDLEKKSYRIVFLNFNIESQKMLLNINRNCENKFKAYSNSSEIIDITKLLL